MMFEHTAGLCTILMLDGITFEAGLAYNTVCTLLPNSRTVRHALMPFRSMLQAHCAH